MLRYVMGTWRRAAARRQVEMILTVVVMASMMATYIVVHFSH